MVNVLKHLDLQDGGTRKRLIQLLGQKHRCEQELNKSMANSWPNDSPKVRKEKIRKRQEALQRYIDSVDRRIQEEIAAYRKVESLLSPDNKKYSSSKTKSRGRPKDLNLTKRIQTLKNNGLATSADLRTNISSRRNAFAELDRAKVTIPGFEPDTDWMSLLNDPTRSDDLKTVLNSLRVSLNRNKK